MTDFDQRDHRVQVGRRNGETSDVSMADLINDLREGVVVQGVDGRISCRTPLRRRFWD